MLNVNCKELFVAYLMKQKKASQISGGSHKLTIIKPNIFQVYK
jgi:hypothetical protein